MLFYNHSACQVSTHFYRKLSHAYSDRSIHHSLTREGLHFWTAFAANSAGLLFVGSINCVVLFNIKSTNKKSLIPSLISCLIAFLVVAGISIVACRLPWTQSFLLQASASKPLLFMHYWKTTGISSDGHSSLYSTWHHHGNPAWYNRSSSKAFENDQLSRIQSALVPQPRWATAGSAFVIQFGCGWIAKSESITSRLFLVGIELDS